MVDLRKCQRGERRVKCKRGCSVLYSMLPWPLSDLFVLFFSGASARDNQGVEPTLESDAASFLGGPYAHRQTQRCQNINYNKVGSSPNLLPFFGVFNFLPVNPILFFPAFRR